ncbi:MULTISPECIES: hypothetical protein [Micromonospora]|uniref:Uncharacterized protein n=1 Tax=Micromonospora sp. HUAS YX12 TaxID=3156396 RepID=A0AAU7R1H3_9ACTN
MLTQGPTRLQVYAGKLLLLAVAAPAVFAVALRAVALPVGSGLVWMLGEQARGRRGRSGRVGGGLP